VTSLSLSFTHCNYFYVLNVCVIVTF